MSKVTEAINSIVFGLKSTKFTLARDLFTEEDEPLIESGAFRLSKEITRSFKCPWCRDHYEDIIRIEQPNDVIEYMLCCRYGEGMKILKPWEYERMEFVPEVYFRNWPALAEKLGVAEAGKKDEGKKRIKRRPRCTEWMKIERQAVIDYANNPKTNPQGKKESALVPIVWRKNKVEFEAAAKLPKGQCGYKDMHTLQAYFFRKEATEKRRKTVVTYPNSDS